MRLNVCRTEKRQQMTTAHDVPAEDLIDAIEDELEDLDAVEAPDWADYSKTGRSRELPPQEDDWWTTRAASLLRKVYLEGPIGVGALKRHYGGKHRKGVEKSHHENGSGSVIRTALQQLEEEGLVEIKNDGRETSAEGQQLLDGLADEIAGEIPELERY